jgi:hypothetical protein
MADSFSFVLSLAPRAIPWLGKLATIAIIALLAWLGAQLFWNLTVPTPSEPAIVVDTDPSGVAQMIAARHLLAKRRQEEPRRRRKKLSQNQIARRGCTRQAWPDRHRNSLE